MQTAIRWKKMRIVMQAKPRYGRCGIPHIFSIQKITSTSCQAMQANMPKEVGDSGLMEDTDSDEPPSGLDDGDDKDNEKPKRDSNLNDENESDTEDDGHTEHSDDISLAEGSDDDDLIDLDEVLPEGLIDYDGSDTEENARR